MNNQDTLKRLVTYLKNVMEMRGMNAEDICDECDKIDPEHSVSKKTVYNMFKKPSSISVSTLLKVSDALDLSLEHIFHMLEVSKTVQDSDENLLVYSIERAAYKGYTGEYHVFFLPTKPDDEITKTHTLVQGTLSFGNTYSTGECSAILTIDSGDLTKQGEPFLKRYEGTLVHSTNGFMFCNLVSGKLGDMWFLVFDHGNLNNKDLACVMGCAATSSSGKWRYPAIHRFCLCNKEQYPKIDTQTRTYIEGLLRLQNDKIIISQDKLKAFLERDDLDPIFRRNVETYLTIATEYYALPKSVLKDGVDTDIFAKTIAELSRCSDLERVYHILSTDDKQLKSVLGEAAPPVVHPQTENKASEDAVS